VPENLQGRQGRLLRCHSGEYFTDGKIHNVGTNGKNDVYKGYNRRRSWASTTASSSCTTAGRRASKTC